MEASLAATGMLEVLATNAVLFMMLSVFPSTSMVSYWPEKWWIIQKMHLRKSDGWNRTDRTHLWEVSQDFWHLVPALPAAHIDDDVTVGVFGQGLGDDGFTTAEGSRDGGGSTLHAPSQRRERERARKSGRKDGKMKNIIANDSATTTASTQVYIILNCY